MNTVFDYQRNHNRVFLNAKQIEDAYNIYFKYPTISIGVKTFKSMTICRAFEMYVGKNGGKPVSDTMKEVIQKYWMTWVEDIYDWINIVGIVPYKLVDIDMKDKRNKHLRGYKYPIVPPFFSGNIAMIFDAENKTTTYEWYWISDTTHKPDEEMQWIVERPPNLMGHITSAMSFLLDDYNLYKIVKESLERVCFQSAHPTHILEQHLHQHHNTNTTVLGFSAKANDNLRKYGSHLSDNQANQLNAASDIIHRRTENFDSYLRNSVLPTKKRILAEMGYNRPHILTEQLITRFKREDPEFVDRTILLDEGLVYKRAEAAKIPLSIDIITRRLDRIASLVVDFPLEMAMGSGLTYGKATNPTRVVNERVKERLAKLEYYIQQTMEMALQEVFSIDIKNEILKKKESLNVDKLQQEQIIKLEKKYQVHIRIMCTPFIDYDTIKQYYLDGIMSKETFARHAFHINGLPLDEIEIFETEEEKEMKPKEKTSKKRKLKKNPNEEEENQIEQKKNKSEN